MAKLRPTQFFNHTKEKAPSSKQCVEIFTEVVFPSRHFISKNMCDDCFMINA